MSTPARIRFLLPLFLVLAALQPVHADSLEDVLIRGWATTHSGKVHYEIHIAYPPSARDRTPPIRSIEIMLGKQKVIFPASALNPSSNGWQVPRGVFGNVGKENEFSLYFSECGDGARSYSLEFFIKHGRVVSRQLIPAGMSELTDALEIFDAQGHIVYDGPCNRSGDPTGKISKEAKLALQ
ncbi:MAG TPA: hypothetical protein VG733_14270 [Chthoniobacteraceae bacterium]|nr:hypothetical protein [Chthoniobacteraceae bacterium]